MAFIINYEMLQDLLDLEPKPSETLEGNLSYTTMTLLGLEQAARGKGLLCTKERCAFRLEDAVLPRAPGDRSFRPARSPLGSHRRRFDSLDKPKGAQSNAGACRRT